jgi:hypothetical protein
MPRKKKVSTGGRTRSVARNAVTGRFIKASTVEGQPNMAVVDEIRVSSSESPLVVVRSLRTGRFVKKSTAKRHPKTTVKERVKR